MKKVVQKDKITSDSMDLLLGTPEIASPKCLEITTSIRRWKFCSAISEIEC